MSSPDIHHKKKRAGKACDSCRIKKTKCDGRKPCSRCVADNRICTFTEKRKNKEKVHPPGYFELLETRVELLTRSLEKMIHLSEPHLPWLASLMARSRAEHPEVSPPDSVSSGLAKGSGSSGNSPTKSAADDYVPINDVVAHLIAQHGLLDNLPVDFDHAALEMGRPSVTPEEDYLTALDAENPQASGHRRLATSSRSASDRSGVSRSSSRRGSRQGPSHGQVPGNLASQPPSQHTSTGSIPSTLGAHQRQITPTLAPGQLTPGHITPDITQGLAMDPDVRPSAQFFTSYASAHPGAMSSSSSLTSLTARFESHDLDPVSPGFFSAHESLASPPGLASNLSQHSSGFSQPNGPLHPPQPLQLQSNHNDLQTNLSVASNSTAGLRRHGSQKDSALGLRRPSDHVHKPKNHSHGSVPASLSLSSSSLSRYQPRESLAPALVSPGSSVVAYDAFSPGAHSALDDFAAFPLDDAADLDEDWKMFTTIRADSNAGSEGFQV